ncbi:MAG: AAA family ATPase, partial [Clostridiales Family XIII bacterium]|nr:AAA family ATPase [Clostridiales Family XIII bacterium]
MISRKAYTKIHTWKQTKTRQGLLVTGARQVGKTYLIREFAKANYKNVVEINLVNSKSAVNVLEEADNAKDLFSRISAVSEKKLIPGETLIFLDEIQEFSEIVTNIKFLVEQTDYDFVLSGSLLGVELKNVRSVPVGYLDTVEMYPLDFEEYIAARGISEDLINIVRQSFADKTEVPDYLHEKMLTLFYEYLIIGGMPAVVAEFCESRNLQNVRRLQE